MEEVRVAVSRNENHMHTLFSLLEFFQESLPLVDVHSQIREASRSAMGACGGCS